jgi:SAM-dependent methyltransferase
MAPRLQHGGDELMVVTVQEHYDNFLAEHYSWMFGDYDAKVNENRDFFKRINITPRAGAKGLDLGCGSGFQSLALSELGFEVLGVDLSGALLEELRGRASGLDIEAVQGDMLDSRLYADKGPFEVAVCMGDTLTHLRTTEDVAVLLENVYRILEQQGNFVLAFRDLTVALKGTERIIPVRADDDKLMATFLEYEENHVNVHDILFLKRVSGWELKTGVYRKLRIASDQVQDLLERLDFSISTSQVEQGFSLIVAQK